MSDRGNKALRLALSTLMYWRQRNMYTEGIARLEAALARSPDAPALWRAEGYNGLGAFAIAQGNYDEARRNFEQALTIAEPEGALEVLVKLYNNLAIIADNQGDHEAAHTLHQK